MNPKDPSLYPKVMSERKTLELLLTGAYQGLARYGDGDFACLRGQMDRYQAPTPDLAYALAEGLRRPHPDVLNAIIAPPGHGTFVNQRWICYFEANAGIIPMLDRDYEYGNASLSRMDSCVQLHTEEWWLEVAKLWKDQEVTLIRGSERSLTAQMMLESPNSPESVTEVISSVRNAWSHYDRILKETRDAGHQVVILCTGLVARPLVHALVAAGHSAFDVGHFGLWFKDGKPIEVPRP